MLYDEEIQLVMAWSRDEPMREVEIRFGDRDALFKLRNAATMRQFTPWLTRSQVRSVIYQGAYRGKALREAMRNAVAIAPRLWRIIPFPGEEK